MSLNLFSAGRIVSINFILFFCWIGCSRLCGTTDHSANQPGNDSGFVRSPVIILSDETLFDLTGYRKKVLERTVRLKIVNQKGVELFDSICLPESFDIVGNREIW